MANQVVWSPEALEDFETLTAYIAASDETAAISTGKAILKKTRRIPLNPHAGRIVPERDNPRIREVFQGNYRIICRLSEGTSSVEILRVWHGARGEPAL